MSPGRVAFGTALLNASMCRRGYAGEVDRKPDCIIGRLEICQIPEEDGIVETDPVLSRMMSPSIAIMMPDC